jgi:two-component system, sensor histidine kinase
MSGGLGQGSESSICLPRSAIVEPAPQLTVSESKADIRLRRILIADDNLDSATSLKMLLELSGHEAHIAHGGAEALDLARQAHPRCRNI